MNSDTAILNNPTYSEVATPISHPKMPNSMFIDQASKPDPPQGQSQGQEELYQEVTEPEVENEGVDYKEVETDGIYHVLGDDADGLTYEIPIKGMAMGKGKTVRGTFTAGKEAETTCYYN